MLGKAGDSDEEDQPVQRPPPSPVVDEDELYELETVAKKAKKAGGTSPQVTQSLADQGCTRWHHLAVGEILERPDMYSPRSAVDGTSSQDNTISDRSIPWH